MSQDVERDETASKKERTADVLKRNVEKSRELLAARKKQRDGSRHRAEEDAEHPAHDDAPVPPRHDAPLPGHAGSGMGRSNFKGGRRGG